MRRSAVFSPFDTAPCNLLPSDGRPWKKLRASSDRMIEYSALLTQAGAHVRARRFPLGAWAPHSFVAADEITEPVGSRTRGRLGLGMTVYVGNGLVRLALLPPVRDAKSLKDFTAIASHILSQRHGLTSSEWEIAADPASPLGLVACAVRREALQSAKRLSERLGQRLRCARVWAGEALPCVEDRPVLLDDGEATVMFVPGKSGNPPQLHVVPNDQAARIIAIAGVEDAVEMKLLEGSVGRLRRNFLDRLRARE